jgi:adenylate cyclase
MACNRKGNVYLDLGDHARALEYYRKALGIYGQGGNRSGIALILGNIGVVYEGQNDYPKALEYYQSALTADEQLGNVESVARHLGNMAHVYIELSEYPRALQYLQRALTINERYGNTRRLAINLASIGNVYDHMHDFPKALEYYQRALSISSEELLLNILPEEVAEELKAKGEAEAQLIDEVTVLFTDFKGFTAMSEKLTRRNWCATSTSASVPSTASWKHGIEKIKTIGDAYMAAGGLPTPNTTHALDVVKAAWRSATSSPKARRGRSRQGCPTSRSASASTPARWSPASWA